MTTKRQFNLLIDIIDYYIKTGEPVSSAVLKEDYGIQYASSTIRYEMATLEEQGYLEKAYKSAGRIPTNKAYEYYVKNITPIKRYSDDMKKSLEEVLSGREKNIDDVLSASLEIINSSANTLSFTNTDMSDSILEDIRIYETDTNSGLVITVFSNGTVNQTTLSIKEISFKDLQIAISLFADRLVGTKASEIVVKAMGLKQLLTESVSKLDKQYQRLINQLFDSLLNQTSTVSGVNSLIGISSESDRESMKHLLSKIKDNSIFSLLKQSKTIETNNTKVYLELASPKLKEVAVIEKIIDVGNSKRKITLLGKKNQNYQEIFEGLDILETELKKT